VPWPAEQATRTAEDVRAAVAAYRGYAFNLDDIIWEYPALGDTVRVSVGVASGAPGDDAAGLLAAADAALAEAAADGDRVVVASV
jgi:PleD family two-component response regulator